MSSKKAKPVFSKSERDVHAKFLEKLPTVQGKPVNCQIVSDILFNMSLNLMEVVNGSSFSEEFLDGQYSAYGMILEIMRWRLAGVSGDPNETAEWAKAFSERMN